MGSSGDTKTNKLKQLDADPFGFGSSSSATGGSTKMTVNLGGEDDPNAMSEKQAQERLKELGNRKAISSEDFINYG